MSSKILLENLKIYAFHGVLPEEKTLGTYYIVDAEITSNFWKATETDNLRDTVNYAEISEIIHDEMKIPSELLEHVAGRMIKSIHLKFPQIEKIKIKIMKTNPPMKGEMKGVSIKMKKNFKK